MAARDIENNLKYGLTRGHFPLHDCWYNVFERKDECGVYASASNELINAPAVGFNQIKNFRSECMYKEG